MPPWVGFSRSACPWQADTANWTADTGTRNVTSWSSGMLTDAPLAGWYGPGSGSHPGALLLPGTRRGAPAADRPLLGVVLVNAALGRVLALGLPLAGGHGELDGRHGDAQRDELVVGHAHRCSSRGMVRTWLRLSPRGAPLARKT